jgi:hypothetical protein
VAANTLLDWAENCGAYAEQTRITYKMEYDKQFKMQVLIAKAKKSY